MQQTQLPASQSNTFFRTNSESLILFETASAATFLHRRPLHCSSNYHSCTGDHFPAEGATSRAPATLLQQRLAVLHQQLPVMNQRLPSCTSDHLPAPADTSDYHSCTSDHLSCISRYQQPPVLYQQLPVLNQRPLSCTSRHQQLPVLNQRPLSCTSGNQSCTSDTYPTNTSQTYSSD